MGGQFSVLSDVGAKLRELQSAMSSDEQANRDPAVMRLPHPARFRCSNLFEPWGEALRPKMDELLGIMKRDLGLADMVDELISKIPVFRASAHREQSLNPHGNLANTDMMALFWRHLRILIEPSSATVIAAVRNHPEIFAGRKVGAIITGGNIHPANWLELTTDSPSV